MNNSLFTLALLMISSTVSMSQSIDTLDINHPALVMKNLKPGMKHYIVYGVDAKGRTVSPWIWRRGVEYTERNGEPVLILKQAWNGPDTSAYRQLYSIVSAKDFRPIYHYTRSVRGIEAFNFSEKEIKGADTVANNAQKNLTVDVKTLPYNWELDLEVFQTLPYAMGKQFAISFYHPGGRSAPQHYLYKVIAEETINGANEQKIACWKLKIDYRENSWAIFWISKQSKEVIKMHEDYNGYQRYKVLLTTAAE
ncbi:MAG TPA: hypothetical protein VD927_15585 [Chryseosolibacter sp.]|nr:hypothetical protein [Chryseosolibacter sp.]